MLGYKKGNTKELCGRMPLHYPADRVYLHGNTNEDVEGVIDELASSFTKFSYTVSNVSVSNAWGSLYNADIEIPVSEDYRNKKIVATFIPSSTFAAMFIIKGITATKIEASLVRATTATVSGTVNFLIYD